MTLRAIISLFLFLPLAAGASYWGYQVFNLLILLLALVLVASLLEILFLKNKLKLGPLTCDREIYRGESGHFYLPLQLDSRLLPGRIRITARQGLSDKSQSPQCRTRERILESGSRDEVSIQLDSRHTGLLILDEVLVEVKGLLGLFKFKKRFQYPKDSPAILVLPLGGKGGEGRIEALNHVQESDLDRRPIKDRSDEIDTIRAYQEGDEVRRIHWPLSARLDKWMVKEYEAPVSVRTHLFLDDFTGYSLETDPEACDRALTFRDRILDQVIGAIEALLARDLELEVHLGLYQSARERLSMARQPIHYRRLLAQMPADSLPGLDKALSDYRSRHPGDRYLLFSRRLTEGSAAAMVQLAQGASQLLYFYFEGESRSREEDHALKIIRESKAEVIVLKDTLSGSGKGGQG